MCVACVGRVDEAARGLPSHPSPGAGASAVWGRQERHSFSQNTESTPEVQKKKAPHRSAEPDHSPSTPCEACWYREEDSLPRDGAREATKPFRMKGGGRGGLMSRPPFPLSLALASAAAGGDPQVRKPRAGEV